MIKKNERGITLISLVITIIVMIILSVILIDSTDGLDSAIEVVNITNEIYEETRKEKEQGINIIEDKWKNVIYKNTIDNTLEY